MSDLSLPVGLTLACLGLTVFIVKWNESPAKKLFYFDLTRYLIYLLIVTPNLYTIINKIEPLIFNEANLGLPPPGLATVGQWISWMLSMSLTEFTVVGGGALFAIIFAVAKGSSTDIFIPQLFGLFLVLWLDYKWTYQDNWNAGIARALLYGITLFLFTLRTFIAFTMTSYIPGAQDYFIYSIFIWYWQFNPLFILFIVFIIIFSFWLPLVVTGYLIYKQYRTQEYLRGRDQLAS